MPSPAQSSGGRLARALTGLERLERLERLFPQVAEGDQGPVVFVAGGALLIVARLEADGRVPEGLRNGHGDLTGVRAVPGGEGDVAVAVVADRVVEPRPERHVGQQRVLVRGRAALLLL